MHLKSYYSPTKDATYRLLLKFSRRSGIPLGTAERDSVLSAINILPGSFATYRPLLPLIYHNASSAGLFPHATESAQDFLKKSVLELIGKELAAQHWLKQTVATFDIQDIPIILLKGAAFADNLYTPDAPRTGLDIDFLVRKADFEKACNIISHTMDPVVLAGNRLATHRTLFEKVFVSKQWTIPTVEVHRGLTNPHIFTIEEEALWSSSQAHPKYRNKNVRILSPENTLLHLAVHAIRDMDFCSHNLLDTHEQISRHGFDEQELLAKASNWGAKAGLYYLLCNSKNLLGTKIDDKLLDLLAPTPIRKYVHYRLLRASIFQSEAKTPIYRLAQIASQLFIPDRIFSAIAFQFHYFKTRIKDIFSG